MAKSEVFCADCMDGMKKYPDKFFDLAVVDPPYGGGGKGLPEKNDSAGCLTSTGRVARTGGKWAAKYGKKSLPGTTRQAKSILMSCFAFPSNKSSGAEITFRYRRAAAFWFGKNPTSRKTSQWRSANMPGRVSRTMRKSFGIRASAARMKNTFIPQKSQSPCTNGFLRNTQSLATQSLTRTWVAGVAALQRAKRGLTLWDLK